MLEDTIAAIATPIGEGGLAVIRISGPEATSIADRCIRVSGKKNKTPSQAESHTLHYGHVVDGDSIIDEVLVATMRAPRTFTGEDVVEISCHGGLLVTKAVLDRVLACGARMAEPGEFSKRAFLNGRIDLTQAEAIADIIHSQTELALSAANEQLAGKLAKRINRLRDDMMLVLAHVEAHIDFPDEDIAPDTHDQLLRKLRDAVTFMDELLRTAGEGRLLRNGIRCAIVGRPNAGKSSLLNQLLGLNRAIVSSIAGTTRDTIEETANIRGIPVIFVDTAGLRDSSDEIEVEGIRRSRESMERADLLLHVIDLSEPLHGEDASTVESSRERKRIIVGNKSDLDRRCNLDARDEESLVETCCTSGDGIESLKDRIKQLCWEGIASTGTDLVMINSRHQAALSRAREATMQAIEAFRNQAPLELPAMDLRIAVNAVGEIVGKTSTDDLLDSIFSQFCIGK